MLDFDKVYTTLCFLIIDHFHYFDVALLHPLIDSIELAKERVLREF